MVDLDAMKTLKEHLDIANNGYCRKDCISAAERAAIPHLIKLGLAKETATAVYLPEAYEIFVVKGLT